MSELLLPFAREVSTGRTVAPEEVPRGNACGCECLFCGAPVQSRQGGTISSHFAHQPKVVDDEEPCPASFERCVFWMAKRVLEEGTHISLPEFKETFKSLETHKEKTYLITEAKHDLPYKLVTFPSITESPRNQISIQIEIAGHCLTLIIASSKQRISARSATVLICMEYLFETYKEQKHNFQEAMQELILNSMSAKKWLYHSKGRHRKCRDHFNSLVDSGLQKREEARRKQQEAADREYEVRQRIMKDKENPHLAERKARRHQELLGIARHVAQRGAESGWQCQRCFVVTIKEPGQCVHCGHTVSAPFDFSEDRMTNLENIFSCGNYAERSLSAAPVLLR